MKTYICKVTEELIANGEKRVYPPSKNCPVARAIQIALRRKDVGVGGDLFTLWSVKEKTVVDYKLPRSAAKFIEKFDNHEKVKPFEFKIKI